MLPVFFIHYYYQYTVPLVISSIMGMQHLFDHPLYIMYCVSGSKNDWELDEEQKKLCKRPFKNSNDPMEAMKNMQARFGMGEEEKSAAAAEKAKGMMGPKEGTVSSKSLKMAEKKAAAMEAKKVK